MTNIDKLYLAIQRLGLYRPEIHIHSVANDDVRVHVYVDHNTGTDFVDDGKDTEEAAGKVLAQIKQHVV